MRIAIGSDHAGLELKRDVMTLAQDMGHEIIDLGCFDKQSVDYPDYAARVCEAVVTGEVHRGILICGTGVGMSIAANKFPGVRAALCHDTYSARATREHNDSNVLCMGQRVVGSGLALDIAKIWLDVEFLAGRHATRVHKITALESR